MHGNRRVNLELVNQLYVTPNTVDFVQISDPLILELIEGIRRLKIEVNLYFEQDLLLLEEVDIFSKKFKKIVGVIDNYSSFIRANETNIRRFFKFTSASIYKELFEGYIKPIIKILKKLKYEVRNAYMEKLEEILKDHNEINNVFVISRHQLKEKTLHIADQEIKIFKECDFINESIFATHLFFIGTPSYYDRKFSEVFYSKKTTFLGYSYFENKIVKRNAFSNLVTNQEVINTNYKDVILGKGFNGINFKTEIEKPLGSRDQEKLAKELEEKSVPLGEKVPAKLAIISNKCSIFIPVDQKVNVLDRESFKVIQRDTKQLVKGALLVFRSHNGSTLIREVADQIIGEKAAYYRSNIEKWKEKLRLNIKKKGIGKVSTILVKKYGISSATENNLKNWISVYSIRPKYLGEILNVFNFNEEEKKEIILSANSIFRAHISAGHKISQSLMEEININLENSLDENGYYKFESKVFSGAAFNIEEIKQISNKSYLVSEEDVLKIFKT